MSEIELLRTEVAELRRTLLELQQGMRAWVENQRQVRAIGLGGDEDFLQTCYNKSLLAKRSRRTRDN